MADGSNYIIRGKADYHRLSHHLNIALLDLIDKALRIFRAGKLLLKIMQAEAGMDALLQNTAKAFCTLQNNDALHPALPGPKGRRHSGGTAADDCQIILQHM